MSAFSLVPRSLRRLAALALVATAVGCASDAPAHQGALRDDWGVILPTGAPAARIVSLNPTTTEILFAIGAGDRVVGRSRWDRWPDSAQAVPEVGDAIRPSVERILAARPDLVLLYASGDNRDAAAALESAGLTVAALRVDRIDDFTRAVRLLGELTGRSAEAHAAADSLGRRLEAVRAARPDSAPRPTVFVHVWDTPLMAIGGGSFQSELVAIAGGRNVYGDVAAPSVQVSFEDVLLRDPDIVLAAPVTARRLRADPRWQALRAVREGRVVAYDTTLLGRPSLHLGEAAESLVPLLTPARAR